MKKTITEMIDIKLNKTEVETAVVEYLESTHGLKATTKDVCIYMDDDTPLYAKINTKEVIYK